MADIEWIKNLVTGEQDLEQKGMVDFTLGSNKEEQLKLNTIEFIKDLRTALEATSEHFNKLRGPQNNIKIYGISKTVADFMLFRNGFKMIFSIRQAGLIQVSSSQMSQFFAEDSNHQASTTLNQKLIASWGAFDEVIWTYDNRPVKLDVLVRYYLSFFAKNSL